MTLKTVTVTGQIFNPDGTPAAGVEGYATLNRPETDNGIVIPTSTFIKADADGQFSIQLWPNARGSGQSQYIVKAYTRRASVLNLVIMVPDVDVPVVITDIAIAQPYPPIDQSLQALLDVQAASVIAQAAKVEALAAEAGALASAQSAAGSATSAGQSAETASTKAQEAGTSAQLALESKNAAALSEQNSAQSKEDAATAKEKSEAWAENPVDDEVEPGQYSAKHHAIKAGQSEQAAAQSKADAEAAKGVAEEKALAASGSATLAGQSASNAAESALSASEDRTAAQESAGLASGSADEAAASKTKAQQWASNPENIMVESGLFSARHYSAKASTEAQDAADSADEAFGYKNTAETAKTDAQNARDKAAQWAENPTDTEVEPGQYSAKHHASKAADSANEAEQSAQAAADSAASIETSFTPAPNKIPIADETGRIPLTWFASINDIGQPGQMGYGVGICPSMPDSYELLNGTLDYTSPNYGNYRYRKDGSIVVWVPAFYYRIAHADNPTYAQYGVNSIDTKPLNYFKDRDEAASSGYALHRAFIDGGKVQPGLFRDKYHCSNNNGIASSLPLGKPLSCHATHNPISELNGAPINQIHGFFQAAKTRGAEWFPESRFIAAAIALLSLAHGQAATSAINCDWYSAGNTNFPKGNNNNAFRDTNDSTVTFTSDGFADGNSALAGSGVPFAKTTHNGQASGIADVNGNMYRFNPGITQIFKSANISNVTFGNPVVVTAASHGFDTNDTVAITSIDAGTGLKERLFKVTVIDQDNFSLNDLDGTSMSGYTSGGACIGGKFYIAKEATAMKDFTSGNSTETDHWGATGCANMMDQLIDAWQTEYPNNGVVLKFGNGSNQVLSESTSGDDWIKTGLGLPLMNGASSAGTALFGNDYHYQYWRNEMALISGLYWYDASSAGPWSFGSYYYRTSSYAAVGVALASYLEP